MCVKLLEEGYEVIGLDNFSNSDRNVLDKIREIAGKSMEFYQYDLRDNTIENLMKLSSYRQNHIDCIIHFAGFKSVPESVTDPLSYYDNNLRSTINVCYLATMFNIPRIIFSSSSTIYSANATPPFEENDERYCESPYGWTKYMSEQIIRDYCTAHNKSYINLRYFNPIGSHPSGLLGDELYEGDSLMPHILRATEDYTLQVYGTDYPTRDGSCIRDYIHIEDLVDAHLQAIRVASPIQEDINVGTGCGSTVLELINIFQESTVKSVNYSLGPRRLGDPPMLVADISKAKDVLGWEPKRSIADMCRDALCYYERNK